MGNKSNLITLRKTINTFNLSRNNYNEFLYGFFFLLHFVSLLNKKKIFLVYSILNLVGNKLFYSFKFDLVDYLSNTYGLS